MAFQKATKKQAKGRMAIDGPSGSGKTFTALRVAKALAPTGKIAVIDTERGSASKYADLFSFDVCEIADDFHPNHYIKALKEAEEAGYEVVVIDSLSHAWEGAGGVLELTDKAAARSKAGNSYTAWRETTPIHSCRRQYRIVQPPRLPSDGACSGLQPHPRRERNAQSRFA